MARADGHWVDTSYRGRVKEFLTERFDSLKDNKRGTAYAAATVGSGIVGYALTGIPIVGAFCSSISSGICFIHSELQISKAIGKRIYELEKGTDKSHRTD